MTGRLLRLALGAGLCVGWTARGMASEPGDPALGSMFRLFTDSDQVSVRSLSGGFALPIRTAGLSLHWNNERVVIPAIQAPVGSAEAVDAITTASRPITGNAFQDFVKVRNELEGQLSRGPMTADYYLSKESDYLGQQLGARYNRDLRDDQLNVSVGTSYGWDAITPLADSDTRTASDVRTTLHWNAVATQILSPTTLLRLGVELNIVDGLQHNAYRNVYAGGTRVAERHPEHRERRDTFLKVSQYLPNRSSLKLNYRFYDDDWGISSHEIGTNLTQYVTPRVSARYEYRYYTQTQAEFYRDEYPTTNGVDGYLSGDYRMADLASHLFGASLHVDMDALAAAHPMLGRMALWLNYQRYFNSNNYSANILETGLDFRFQ